MKVRHRARVAVLQALYEADCAGHEPGPALEARLEEAQLPDAGSQFARELAHGVSARREQLDALIGRYAPEWPVEQIAIIDRNILRMAIYEIAAVPDTPIKVAINEAVELAKAFGSDSSSRFVNGVLGTLVAKETNLPRR
jgi:transcription antitermination protein NusB